MIKRIVLYSLLFTSLLSVSAYAGTDDETAYALNTLLFLVSGFLVMLMAAGFCMLESGMVTSKSVSTIAANKKKGHILILSANVPDTIETVVAQKTIWKNQSEPSE